MFRKTKVSAAQAITPAKGGSSKAASKRHNKATTAAEVEELAATAAVMQQAVPPVTPRGITHDDIAQVAFSYWEQRGYCGGSADDDWSRAERELRSRQA